MAIFKEHTNYMYAIFNRTVMTTVGATIVREHEQDKDAQAIYSKLVQRAMLSTQATLDSESLIAYSVYHNRSCWYLARYYAQFCFALARTSPPPS